MLMGLARRVIPTILVDGSGTMIKRQRFDDSFMRSTGNTMQAMMIHQLRGVDEVLLLDITATREGRRPQYELISHLAQSCFFPLTVGGGVSTLDHIERLLRSGADKVAIGSHVRILSKASERFGKQAISAVLDICQGEVYDHVTGKMWGVPAEGAARIYEKAGAGEIILQCVERDGTMEGYNLETIKSVAEEVSIPVVASGGCSGYEDMHHALQAGADAVAAGALFQFQDATPQAAAAYLHDAGWEVRNERRTG